MRFIFPLSLTALFLGAPLGAEEPVQEASTPWVKQLFGGVPKAISGNPVAESDMPGTGLAGRFLHLPEDTGLRLGGIWLADSNILLSGGAEPGKWSFNRKRGQALPIDMSNFLTSFLMSGRPTAAEQYRQTRLGSPM